MLETLFENNYVRDKRSAKEIYGYYYFKSGKAVIIYILSAICILAAAYVFVISGEVMWEILVFILFLFLLRFYLYSYQVRIMMKRDDELYGKEIAVRTEVYDDFIQNTVSSGSVNRLEYDNIKSAAQTKNLILLLSKANLVYIFNKDTFTKGTKDEFISFLRNKGIRIK